ncbi:sigma factor-like helix-turn-helix DNA-binding protein, partial [Bacteroides acidifaciens]
YAKELQLLIKLTLDNMPEQRRKVFSMSRQQGMSNQEIADSLRLSIRTVERHIYLFEQGRILRPDLCRLDDEHQQEF